MSEAELRDPWSIAYECSINKCNIDEVASILKEKLSTDIGSEDYIYGLELLKALKSQVKTPQFINILRKTLDRKLVDKLVGEINCDRIIEFYKTSRDLGYSLLVVLEIYPLIGYTDMLKSIIIGTISRAEGELDDKERLELCKAIIHGPLSMLPLSILKDVIRFFNEKIDDRVCLQASVDLLVMITQNYPPKNFIEVPEISDILGDLLKNISSRILKLLEDDPDTAIQLYHEITLFKTYMSNICRELGNWDICNNIWRRAGKEFDEMYEEIGKLEIIGSTGSIENYTSS